MITRQGFTQHKDMKLLPNGWTLDVKIMCRKYKQHFKDYVHNILSVNMFNIWYKEPVI